MHNQTLSSSYIYMGELAHTGNTETVSTTERVGKKIYFQDTGP